MTVQQLKDKIENNEIEDEMIVLVCDTDSFIAHQYIHQISVQRGLRINAVDAIPDKDPFGGDDDCIFLCSFDKLDETNYKYRKNCIVMCKKVSKKLDCPFCTELPKLEQWQLEDYVKQMLPGLNERSAQMLSQYIKSPYELQNEIDKLSIFPSAAMQPLFEEFYINNVFTSVTNKTIFDFTNALFSKDKEAVAHIYKNIEACDIEPLGLTTILYNSIKNMIKVSMQLNPTEENTGLKSNQIYAIKKSAAAFTREQLLNMFDMITQIDFKLKSGQLAEDQIIDYIVVSVLMT